MVDILYPQWFIMFKTSNNTARLGSGKIRAAKNAHFNLNYMGICCLKRFFVVKISTIFITRKFHNEIQSNSSFV